MRRTRLVRSILGGLLLATAGMTGAAQAEVVSFSGTGTVWGHIRHTRSADGNWTVTRSIPADLAAAFPIGTTFVARQTYDTARMTGSTVFDATHSSYQGMLTSFQIDLSSGQTITSSEQDSLHVYNNNAALGSGIDSLQMGTRGLVDGSANVLGYTPGSYSISIFDTDGTALAGSELPTAVCLAEWEQIGMQFAVYSPDPSPNLSEYYLIIGHGEPDRTIDSDRDGLNDGDERLLRSDPTGTLACLSGCKADSDGDGLADGNEVTAGTDPCSVDTDGDGLADGADPAPLVPGTGTEPLAETVRATANGVLEITEGAFSGPNANARRGRRNALANQLQEVANLVEAGRFAEALDKLEHIATLLDGDPSPPDVMGPGPDRDALRDEINDLIALVRAAL